MLNFRDHDWLAVPGATHLWVDILPEDRTVDDLRWSLEFRYVATGGKWRRVRHSQRPKLDLTVSIFRPCVRRWDEFEHVSFWFREAVLLGKTEPGSLIANYFPKCGLPAEHYFLDEHIWRVSGRNGRFLTVELAAFGGDSGLADGLAAMLVPTGADDAPPLQDADFWKENSQLYLVEEVPFGVVTVQTPRNVADPEAYALGRAKSLLGLEFPSEVQIVDYVGSRMTCELMHGNFYVHLHFHGFYED